MQNGLANPNNAGAAAYPYMNLMGVVCLGLMWLRMAKASAAALANGTGNADFHKQQARHRPLLRRPHHAGEQCAPAEDRGRARTASWRCRRRPSDRPRRKALFMNAL